MTSTRLPGLVAHAYAKINLGLEVLGRRSDGLHEVTTILQTVSLADRLEIRRGEELTLRCRGMTATPTNLILRAAHLLQQRSGGEQGAAMQCIKRIPVAAGLGGGSADAGATLRALNVLWACNLSDGELAALGAELGADVPFTLRGGTALATGSGRGLTLLADAPACWLVLTPFTDAGGDKTREMYASLLPSDYSDGAAVREQAASLVAGRIAMDLLPNAFLRAACERFPQVAGALRALEASGAAGVTLAGAGPSCFGLYATRGAALQGYQGVRRSGLEARLCSFIPSARAQVLERTGCE
jgi:4-diphosphocytidyl-2-C-methyl-D-erythritol kinase